MATTTAQHTPTPWRLGRWGTSIVGPAGDVIALEGPHAAPEHDLAFIVRAVNAHDALVEALQAILYETNEERRWDIQGFLNAITKARAALAQVEP